MVSRSALYSPPLSKLLAGLSGSTPYDRLKSALFVYVVITYTRKAYRHALARGVRDCARDAWLLLARVSMHLHASIC